MRSVNHQYYSLKTHNYNTNIARHFLSSIKGFTMQITQPELIEILVKNFPRWIMTLLNSSMMKLVCEAAVFLLYFGSSVYLHFFLEEKRLRRFCSSFFSSLRLRGKVCEWPGPALSSTAARLSCDIHLFISSWFWNDWALLLYKSCY